MVTIADTFVTLLNVAAASYTNLGVKPGIFQAKKESWRKIAKNAGKKGSQLRVANVNNEVAQSSDATVIFSTQTGSIRGRSNSQAFCDQLFLDVKSLITSNSGVKQRVFITGETEPTPISKNLYEFEIIAQRIDF